MRRATHLHACCCFLHAESVYSRVVRLTRFNVLQTNTEKPVKDLAAKGAAGSKAKLIKMPQVRQQ